MASYVLLSHHDELASSYDTIGLQRASTGILLRIHVYIEQSAVRFINADVNVEHRKLSFTFSTCNILINSLYFNSDFKIDSSGCLRHFSPLVMNSEVDTFYFDWSFIKQAGVKWLAGYGLLCFYKKFTNFCHAIIKIIGWWDVILGESSPKADDNIATLNNKQIQGGPCNLV